MADTAFQAFSVRLPVELHRKARIKSIETGKTMQEIVIEKIAEWVAEREPAQPAPRERQGPLASKKASK